MTKKKDTLNLTYKIPILKPISADWKTFGKIAGDITYSAIQIMNDAIDMHYLHQKEKLQYKKDTGKNMSVKEVYGVGSYTTVINRTLKNRHSEMLKTMAGDIFEMIVRQAIDTFNTNSGEILKGNAKLSTFRRDQPIPVRGRSLKLNEKYTIKLPLLSKEKAKEIDHKGQSFEVQLETRGNGKIILDRILSGEYGISDSQIQRTLDGKWFLLLAYKQPIEEVKMDKDTIVGIDLGINKVAYMAVNNSKQNFFIDGGEMRAFRNRIRGRRRSLQNQLRVCSQNRRGHGRKTLLRPLETLREKESNFNSLANHRYSKAIVEWAEKQGAGTIQMEDLSNIKDKRKDNKMLGDWTYYDLATKIEYKAKAKGIDVVKVNPLYTSQRCSKCGVIHKENRNVEKNGQEVFHCVTCGHKTNADLNAARNIAVKDIDKEIKKQLKARKDLDSKMKNFKK